MLRTCNGLELRDQIPPLPPPVALSRLHHSPHKTSRSTSPHLQHRVQSLNMLDEISGAYGGSCAVAVGASTITASQSVSTNGWFPLDHPLTPTKFRQKASTAVQTNGIGMESSTSQYSGYGTIHHQHHAAVMHQQQQQYQQPYIHHMSHGVNAAKSSSTTTLHQQHTHPYHLYRQQSTSSANFSPVPAPLHPHQQHQSTTTCDLIGNTNLNMIKSTTTVNSVATASTLAGSCCSVNGAVQIHQGLGAGAACDSAANRTQQTGVQTTTTTRSMAACGGDVLPECQREGGTHCCSASKNRVRHRWHKCPELYKAMDGVTYIWIKRKEEESTR
ncbi:hypothetical protein EVAR_72857_1, partial [Eumeta japonica]